MAGKREYVVMLLSQVTDQMIDDCLETSRETLRLNNDGTKTILKYEGEKPASLTPYVEYDHDEILEILSAPEWTTPIE